MSQKADDVKMVIVARKDLKMRKGKLGAQCGHASLAFMMRPSSPGVSRVPRCDDWTDVELRWFESGTTKIVVGVDSERELRQLMHRARRAGLCVNAIHDAGRTEFHGETTLTCCAFGPDLNEKMDPVTGDLVPL